MTTTNYAVEISEVDMKRASKSFIDLMNRAGAKRDPKKAFYIASASILSTMIGALIETMGEEEAKSIMHQSVDNAILIHTTAGFKSPWK